MLYFYSNNANNYSNSRPIFRGPAKKGEALGMCPVCHPLGSAAAWSFRERARASGNVSKIRVAFSRCVRVQCTAYTIIIII